MKKVLLTTTALVMTAGVAAADTSMSALLVYHMVTGMAVAPNLGALTQM